MRLTGLPRQRTSFIGRERELARVLELAQRSRLVTLLGPPGAGKTRLAIEAAGRMAGDDTPAVAFVDLTQLVADADAADAVLGAIGMPRQPGERALSAVIARLQAAPLLLVIDNCEHVLAQVALMIDQWLGACPGVRMLATSREPLGVPGEVRL